jgi:hypothetical protein
MQLPATEFSHNPFALLTFLAAPALLTNASTLMALSTSNRLARAADRARTAAAAAISNSAHDPMLTELSEKDFEISSRRARLLVSALSAVYLAIGCFSTGTLVALIGAFAGYFAISWAVVVTQMATIGAVVVGVISLASAALRLVGETRLALRVIDQHHAAMTKWRATRKIMTPEGV